MITLAHAFRLCSIASEPVYLRRKCESDFTDHYFWSDKVRRLFDMKRIKVVGIEPRLQKYGPDYLGMLFIVTGITEEELRNAEYLRE